MTKFLVRLLILGVVAGATGALAAGDPQAGAAKSTACHACHGSDGISINDLWPNLAGQKQGYLVKQITAFRDGTRQDPIMPVYVRSLSDQDIADIAAFYSGLSGVERPRAQLH